MNAMKKLRRKIDALRSGEDGTSAIEFGLVTPILFFSLLAVIDVGMAVNERIVVGQALRAGAEQAMYDPGVSVVETVAKDAARQAFSVDGSGGSLGEMSITVTEYCECPNATGVAVACSAICTLSTGGEVSPYKYYDLSGEKTYESIIIPEMTFNSDIRVMVR